MSCHYVKILINGFEEKIDIFWIDRIARTSTRPGNETGTAFLLDGETEGEIDNEGIVTVRKVRPGIITTSPLVEFCDGLKKDRTDPYEEVNKTLEEWWEELNKA